MAQIHLRKTDTEDIIEAKRRKITDPRRMFFQEVFRAEHETIALGHRT